MGIAKSPMAGILSPDCPFVGLSAGDLRRIQLGSIGINACNIGILLYGRSWLRQHLALSNGAIVVCDRLGKWPSPSLTSLCVILSVFSLADFCCGDFHLLAWNTTFPNITTRWSWRYSAILIILSGALVLWRSSDHARDVLASGACSEQNWPHGLLKRAAVWLTPYISLWSNIALGTWFVFYTPARAFLVIECFMNLLYLPDSVYLEPDWSRYVPHVTRGF